MADLFQGETPIVFSFGRKDRQHKNATQKIMQSRNKQAETLKTKTND